MLAFFINRYHIDSTTTLALSPQAEFHSVFAKNMIDQRTYYEFLLHKVIIGYGPPAQASGHLLSVRMPPVHLLCNLYSIRMH